MRASAVAARRLAGLAGLAALAGLVAGCSSQTGSSATTVKPAPPVSAFSEGTCRVVAPDVLTIGRDAHRLGKGPAVDAGVVASLTAAQTAVRQVAPGAEPRYQPALNSLVTAVGLVRLQARVGSYHPEQGANLVSAYDAVVGMCTTAAPSPA